MRLAISLALTLALTSVSQAAIWKCQVEGKPVFSDKPCVEGGDQFDTSTGQSSGFSASREGLLRDQARRRQMEQLVESSRTRVAGKPDRAEPEEPRVLRPSHCPSRQEMANLRTSLSSNHLKPEQSLSAELEAAERCHRGIGTYTASDWSTLRDIRTDVGSIDARTRQRGSAREAAVYRMADPELAAEFAERVRLQEFRQSCARRDYKAHEPAFSRGPRGCLLHEEF
jgi:hypothetical protein